METRWPDVMAWRLDGTIKEEEKKKRLFYLKSAFALNRTYSC